MKYVKEDVVAEFTPPINPVTIGKIMGAYGILGWVRIISFTEKSDNIFKYSSCFVTIKSKWRSIYLEKWRLIGKRYIAKVRGIVNRDSAQLLNHCDIIVDETQLPSINNNEYYWKDLIGCKVITTRGVFLGNVINIIETTANDVLIVKMCKDNFVGVKDCLIPFLFDKVIKNVDIFTHTVTVDWDPDF